MRGVALFVVLLGTLALASAAQSKPVRYRVVAANASADLTYVVGNDETGNTRGTVDLRVVRAKGKARATLNAGAGTIRFRVTGRRTEQATIAKRQDPTSPYVEDFCSKRAAVRGSGGLVLRRVGSKVELRWGFPLPLARTCPGPVGVSSLLRSQMKQQVARRTLSGRRVVLTLSGVGRFKVTGARGSMRWRAVVTLVRS